MIPRAQAIAELAAQARGTGQFNIPLSEHDNRKSIDKQ
jgi:hypothetical protein